MTKPRRGKTLSCKRCGGSFYRKPSHVESARYCSRQCQFESFITGKERTCQECGAKYYRSPSQVRHRGAKYCTDACKSSSMSRRQRGAGNTFYRGNKIKVTKVDNYFSRYIRIRDQMTCQRCNKSYVWGQHGLDNSHFIGRANRSTRWEPDNCDALCRGCHSYMETHKATLYRDWKIARLGQERFDALIALSNGKLRDAGAAADRVRELLMSVNNGKLTYTGFPV